ncbi:hypothetical protein U8527_11675 [Kordia algicida OT-1]|uniref:Uncharacterized protein n=1 Tax=Kordia algicida OT-1 TaxID=391587 RepID=A9DZX2_9FLAO|nr:hypothetical protein [Kordia algicida]EDP95772.1 hypothetical protein KAOT1_05192 [Kordia algicida OT-1]
MKNIKDILNEKDVTAETPKLPKGHRAEFLEKLATTEGIPAPKSKFYYWKNIAAACVLFIGIGAFIYTNYGKEEIQESSLFTEMKSIEDQYLQSIADEWKSFELTANDTHLVKKYKERLENLDASYQELKQEFLVQKNSLTTLEKMIKNLQMRLSLLQEIQQHLKRLQDEQNNI